MSVHAVLSPSSAYRWRKCTASVGQSRGITDNGNDAARWGTATHLVASECLEKGCDSGIFVGREVLFCVDYTGYRYETLAELLPPNILGLEIKHRVPVDDEIAQCAQAYVEYVRELVKTTGAEMFVEQRVPIGWITGEEDAGGTSDTILIDAARKELTIVDLKGGMGKVVAYEIVKPALPDPITGEMQPPVYEPNSQLAMYAGGSLHAHALMYDFDDWVVKMTIVQPRLNHLSEFSMPVADLMAYLATVSAAAEATRSNPTFVPGDHCTFCKGRETCTARTQHVVTTALEGFADVNDAQQIAQARPREVPGQMLGVVFEKLAMVRQWCDDIGSRVYSELMQGNPVVNDKGLAYKLVAGKKGSRNWRDASEVEALLKSYRLKQDEMYDFSLISPTTADKLAHPKAPKGQEPPKPVIGTRQWTKLEKMIAQAEGRPTVALETDPRPALPSASSGFEQVSPTSADTVDYFN